LGLTALNNDPGLGDLACDPVTFQRDTSLSQITAINPLGRDLYRDAVWSRRGANGNMVAAVEFPAFTCGLPSNSVDRGFSPLAAGLSTGTAVSPGLSPLPSCFDANGIVKDTDGDGLPDCWETNAGGSGPLTTGGIDFDGDGTRDFTLCAQVNIDGGLTTTLTQECADQNHKDLFVEIDYMQFHKPDPQALSQQQSVTSVGVKSVREAFAAAPVLNPPPDNTTSIRIHFQVDEELSHVDQIIFTPCTTSAGSDPTKTVVDFDTITAANFGTLADAQTTLNAKRLAFRYVVFGHDLAPLASGSGLGSSGCAEVGGDDAVVTLGSFSGSVAGHTGGVGSTDEQAGTLMHEFGHLLGLRHGGDDAVNCKPNYRSVMSYSRQLSGSPIVGRRLDYSRSKDPVLAGFLNELSLNESVGLGTNPSLGPIPGRNTGDAPFFSSADQIAFGPGAWKFAAANVAPINWNNSKDKKGVPTIDTSLVPANINDTSACTSLASNEVLYGFDDWKNILYRASAAIDSAGGRGSESQEELTQQGAEALFLETDADTNGAGDGTDCGGPINPKDPTYFPCEHRIDIKPSFPLPKIIDPGTEANMTIAIFSECSSLTPSGLCMTGSQVWNASTQVILTDLENFPLTFSVETYEVSVKVNSKGGGTCSISDVADPLTGQKDGIKDLKCQFPVGPLPDGTTLPTGTHFGVVSGYFFDPRTLPDPDNPNIQIRAFTARQEVNMLE
jgi:hypothetical protein